MFRWAIGLMCVSALVAGNTFGAVRGRFRGGASVRIEEIEEDRTEELRRQREAFRRKMGAARSRISGKKWAEARKIADKARLLAADGSQLEELRKLYLRIDKEGRRQLKEARDAYAKGEYVEAVEAFELIGRIFGGLPSGAAARKVIEIAKQDPAARAALQEPKAAALDQLVTRILGKASRSRSQPATAPTTNPTRPERIMKLPPEGQVRVVSLLEKMARLYGASATGHRARGDLEALRADEAFFERLARYRQAQKARRALKKAETYYQAGMIVKAAEYYGQVVRDFPDSLEAAKAKAALSIIQNQLR